MFWLRYLTQYLGARETTVKGISFKDFFIVYLRFRIEIHKFSLCITFMVITFYLIYFSHKDANILLLVLFPPTMSGFRIIVEKFKQKKKKHYFSLFFIERIFTAQYS